MKNRNIDLLNSSVTSSIVKLALPIMAGSLLSLAYSLTDMFWVGKIGTHAVAAVGTGGLLMWVVDGIVSIMRIGGQVHAGQSYGRSKLDNVRTYGREALRLGYLAATIIFLLFFFATNPIVSIFNFNQEITFNSTITYVQVISLGMIAVFGGRILSGLLTTVGNSKSPFIANALGLVVNMVLDPVMITVLGWGVFGAGLATIIAQFIVFFILLYVAKKDYIWSQLHLFTEKVSWNAVKEVLQIGIPAGIQSLIRSLVTVVLSRMVVKFGDVSVAVQRFGSQVESITWLTAEGFGAAISAFISQNFGAGKGKRVKKGYRSASIIVLVICIGATALLFFLASEITALFMHEPAAIAGGRDYLKILSASQIMQGLELITISSFAALGQTRFTAIISSIFIGARIPLAAWLSSTALGVNGIWWSLTITTNISALVMIIFFHNYVKKLEDRQILVFG